MRVFVVGLLGLLLSLPSEEPPARQEIYITVSNRKELLVRTGQGVKEGQILADTRGTTARKIGTLLLQRQIYEQETIRPLPFQEPPPLGRPSFLREESRLAQAIEEVEAQKEIIQQLPDDPNILAHEQAKLRKLERERDILQGELDNKKYQYSLELNRTEGIKQSQRADYQRQLALWQQSELRRRNELLKIDLEISELKEQETLIRSPYNGTIQKVIWQSQRGNRLDVLLILLPSRSESRNPLPSQHPGVLGGLALIGDGKFPRSTGIGYCPVRVG